MILFLSETESLNLIHDEKATPSWPFGKPDLLLFSPAAHKRLASSCSDYWGAICANLPIFLFEFLQRLISIFLDLGFLLMGR